MRCTSPRTVGFQADGKTIAWSQKKLSKEYASFQLPCGKCLPCRLDYARQWAVRCVHEAQMYEQNCFITLTYSEENLKSNKLQYIDFQLFMKRLRDKIYRDFVQSYGKTAWLQLSKEERKEIYKSKQIGVFVTGEYGDKQKRPHWHACIFNWSPLDGKYKYSNDREDKVYESQTLTELWGHGIAEYGSVTFQSAGYVARYATKKLVHGNDGEHEYEPISKKSSKQAIGKKWLEKYWQDAFNQGQIVLPDGARCAIPRYYEKWLKDNKPEEWLRYVTRIKLERAAIATRKAEEERQTQLELNEARGQGRGIGVSRTKARLKILNSKIKQLSSYRKL